MGLQRWFYVYYLGHYQVFKQSEQLDLWPQLSTRYFNSCNCHWLHVFSFWTIPCKLWRWLCKWWKPTGSALSDTQNGLSAINNHIHPQSCLNPLYLWFSLDWSRLSLLFLKVKMCWLAHWWLTDWQVFRLSWNYWAVSLTIWQVSFWSLALYSRQFYYN